MPQEGGQEDAPRPVQGEEEGGAGGRAGELEAEGEAASCQDPVVFLAGKQEFPLCRVNLGKESFS